MIGEGNITTSEKTTVKLKEPYSEWRCGIPQHHHISHTGCVIERWNLVMPLHVPCWRLRNLRVFLPFLTSQTAWTLDSSLH